jgi:PAS domain S-box-containing protein
MNKANKIYELTSGMPMNCSDSKTKILSDQYDYGLYYDIQVSSGDAQQAMEDSAPHPVHGVDDRAVDGSRPLEELLLVQRQIMDVILQGASLEQALSNIAMAANRILQPALCAIHLANPDGKGLRLNPGPGLSAVTAKSAEPIEVGPGRGAVAAAAYSGQRVAVDDLEREPMCGALRRFVRQNGLGACEVFPIRNRRNALLGTLTLYHAEAPAVSPDRERMIGFLMSLAGFAIEIEQRHRDQRFVNERFASLAATIPGVVYQRLVTPDGDIRYTYISEGAQDLFGVSPEEILADPNALFACHGPEYRTNFRERLLTASRELSLWDVEAQIITRDGEEKWTHAIARPRRQPDGSVLWDGVILDATRIKRSELELRKARAAAEAMSKSYREVRYTYISEGAQDLFGVSPEEILADPSALFACHGPEYRTTFRERLLRASRELSMWDVQAQIITRDGEEKWTHAIARPRRQPDGSVLWDGVILDATRIKRSELELRKARAAAEAMSKSYREVLQSEVFGPLGSDKYRDYASDIHRSGTQLLTVINNILEFTKCGTGALELTEGKVGVQDVLDAVARQAAPIAESAGVTLTTAAESDLPEITADRCKLHEILAHLLSNAVKFTPPRGSVHLSAARSDSGDIVVRVKDTGIGIAEEDMPKLLEPFGQADYDLNRQYDGIGLGIPLAANLAKLHGARLTAESEVGVGTTVTLVFPRSRVLDGPPGFVPPRRGALTAVHP